MNPLIDNSNIHSQPSQEYTDQVKIPITQQNQYLISLVRDLGKKNWSQIAHKLNQQFSLSKTGKQCRDHYSECLQLTVDNSPMTNDEKLIISQSFLQHGNKWRLASLKLKNRTVNQVKNCFYSTIRKSLRRVLKYLGRKKVSKKIKQIKPTILSRIFNTLSKDFDNPSQLIKLIFEVGIEKSLAAQAIVEKNKKDLKKVINILEQTNKSKQIQMSSYDQPSPQIKKSSKIQSYCNIEIQRKNSHRATTQKDLDEKKPIQNQSLDYPQFQITGDKIELKQLTQNSLVNNEIQGGKSHLLEMEDKQQQQTIQQQLQQAILLEQQQYYQQYYQNLMRSAIMMQQYGFGMNPLAQGMCVMYGMPQNGPIMNWRQQ